ncbi:hypothetical protein NQD34_009952 [Periophthalmus magnuspinnatus]|nr:hypothetical protein NQD34_009952 [Periophthalmus magnuspinnatus]
MKRTLSDKSVTEFKEIIEPLLKDMSCDNDNNFNPIVTDQLVDRTMLTLKSALDVVAPLKQESIKPRPPAPWYTLQLRTLKQHVRRTEKLWRRSRSEQSLKAWKLCLLTYKAALRKARTRYYPNLIEVNKNNPRFLFSTVARLTNSHNANESLIPSNISCDDFLHFIDYKITTIRDKINKATPKISSELIQSVMPISHMDPLIILDKFTPVDEVEITSAIMSSKPSPCMLDPIPIRLLKEALPQY